MDATSNGPRDSKISAGFSAKLARLGSGDTVRAVVVTRAASAERKPARRQSRQERKAAIEAVRQAAEEALPEIDRVLKEAGGRRLTDSPDALGSIAVETTAAGIMALAESSRVKVVLEDQSISPERGLDS